MGAMKSLLALNPERAHDWWIGLHYGAPEEWHWSLADEEFYQKGERNYRNFQNMDVTNSFVSHEHGKWYTVDHANLWFICYDGKENIRSGEWTLLSIMMYLCIYNLYNLRCWW
jgi:hypothetical protein